jgi:uncharacterized protein YuzE
MTSAEHFTDSLSRQLANRGNLPPHRRSYIKTENILLLVDAHSPLVHEDSLARETEEESMKLSYFPNVDSLYIDLAGKPGTEVTEVAQNVSTDVDEKGKPVGIQIAPKASNIVDLARLDLEGLSLSILGRLRET